MITPNDLKLIELAFQYMVDDAEDTRKRAEAGLQQMVEFLDVTNPESIFWNPMWYFPPHELTARWHSEFNKKALRRAGLGRIN
jgi:hypothetical protein